MTIANIETKAAFYTALERRIQKQSKDKALIRFARFYYSQAPLSELLNKDWESVLAAVRSGWDFYGDLMASGRLFESLIRPWLKTAMSRSRRC